MSATLPTPTLPHKGGGRKNRTLTPPFRTPRGASYGFVDDVLRLADGRVSAQGLGPGQNRPPGRPAGRQGDGPPTVVASTIRAGAVRLVRGLRHLHGSRDRPRDPDRSAGRGIRRLHPPCWADGHVSLDG